MSDFERTTERRTVPYEHYESLQHQLVLCKEDAQAWRESFDGAIEELASVSLQLELLLKVTRESSVLPWRKAADELPDEGERVLVWGRALPDGRWHADYDRLFGVEGHWNSFDHVTHWVRLSDIEAPE
jgi:hypothetical protein